MIANDFNSTRFPTWCPGCGNWGIWASLKNALVAQKISLEQLVLVYGIGCSGNMADFVKVNGFHALHGRAVPTAVGIKIANHKLKVVAVVGDGDCYGEGGNHLIHAIRGNHDVMVIVHDNKVYGLTTGQVSPTASRGFTSKSTPQGVIEVRDNPLALSLAAGGTFIAQGFAGDLPHLTGLLEKGLGHSGFSLINVLQPCVTFNPFNTYDFYRTHTYKLDRDYRPDNRMTAFQTLFDENKLPLGVIYQEKRPTYTESLPQLKDFPLVERKATGNVFPDLLTSFK